MRETEAQDKEGDAMTADYRQLIALQRAARELQRLALDVVNTMTDEE